LINYHKIQHRKNYDSELFRDVSKLGISVCSVISDGTVWSELQYSISEESIAISRRFVFNPVAILGRGEKIVFVHELFSTAVGSPDHIAFNASLITVNTEM
jgi:hypothetical protein